MRESVEKAKGNFGRCGKVAFDTWEEAKARIVEINTEDTHDHRKPQRTYICNVCGKFHLTAISKDEYFIRERKKDRVIKKKIGSGKEKQNWHKKYNKK